MLSSHSHGRCHASEFLYTQVMTDEELQQTNPVVALLRTLLPWVNLQPGAEQARPATPPEIPQALWDAALGTFPQLAEHLDELGLHPHAEGMDAEMRQRIGRAMADFLLEHR